MQEHIAALESKGVIERTKSRSRGIRLSVREGFTPRAVPLLGQTTAGQPELALENHEGFITVDASLIRGENVFALKVRGESMIDEGILDGDMVFINQQDDVESGEAALVLVNNEDATIKKVYRHGQKVELRPANQAMKSTFLDARHVRIQGKVIAVFRTR